MLKLCLSYGCVAGVLVGVPLSVMTIAGPGHIPNLTGMLIGYLTMLIALSTIFVAVKRHRDHALGGVIRFGQALAIGLGISVVAGIFYVAAWEAACAIAHLDFADTYAKMEIAQKAASGASEEELQRFTVEMDKFRQNYANPLYRLPMTFAEIFPVGVLVSLICAGLLSNRRFLPARTVAALILGVSLMTNSAGSAAADETAGHITGVGGVFFKAKDPKALSEWYRDMLGLPLQPWGGAKLRYDAPKHPPAMAWNAFPASTDYFAPSTGDFMINYAVDDMDALVTKLKAKGVTILEQKDDDMFGRFAWIVDPEGNKIELWEPKRAP